MQNHYIYYAFTQPILHVFVDICMLFGDIERHDMLPKLSRAASNIYRCLGISVFFMLIMKLDPTMLAPISYSSDEIAKVGWDCISKSIYMHATSTKKEVDQKKNLLVSLTLKHMSKVSFISRVLQCCCLEMG